MNKKTKLEQLEELGLGGNDLHLPFAKWIKVKDEPPPVDELILIFTSSAPSVRIGFYMNENRVMKAGFWEIREGMAEEIENATHWMEFPEPPIDE